MSLHNTHAQAFRRTDIYFKIGEVLEVKGQVTAYGNFGRTIQYLKRGDRLGQKLKISVAKDSSLLMKISYNNHVKLTSGTRITLQYNQARGRFFIRLLRGAIRSVYDGAATPEIFVSAKTIGTYYSAEKFDAALKNQKFYFRKIGLSKVYKFNRSSNVRENKIQVSRARLELLSQNTSDDNERPIYRIKKGHSIKKSHKGQSTQTASNPLGSNEAALAEAASIFGDSIANDTTTAQASDIFGSDSSTVTDEAQDIFGASVDTKSEKEKSKLKDNVGLKLESRLLSKNLPDTQEKQVQQSSDFSDFDMSFFSRSSAYSQAPRNDVGNIDPQAFHQDIRFSIGNKLSLSDSESLTFSGYIEASNRKDIYNEPGEFLDLRSSKRHYLNLNELYYTYSTRKFDVQFGKKVIKLGKGIIYSPTDSISATDVTVPTSPIFLGNFIFSIDYYLKGWTLSTILFPTIVPNKSPDQDSRWSTIYSDLDYQLDQEFPKGFSSKSRQVLVKLEGTKWSTDWMFTFFNGPNPNPVIRNDIIVDDNVPSFTLVQEYIPITFFSMGFSTIFSGFEVHGEVLNQNAAQGKDDSFLATMIGTRYTIDTWPKNFGLNTIDIILEYGKETLSSSQSQPFYALSSLNSRIYQNSIVGSFIFNINDDLSASYDFHFDNKNSASATILGANWNTDLGRFRLKYESFDGDETSQFGLWSLNDNMSLEYIYNF